MKKTTTRKSSPSRRSSRRPAAGSRVVYQEPGVPVESVVTTTSDAASAKKTTSKTLTNCSSSNSSFCTSSSLDSSTGSHGSSSIQSSRSNSPQHNNVRKGARTAKQNLSPTSLSSVRRHRRKVYHKPNSSGDHHHPQHTACRLLPHGHYTLWPAVLTTMAWLASIVDDGCGYARLSGGTLVAQLAQNPEAPWIEAGFAAFREPTFNTRTHVWETSHTGVCFMYPQDPDEFTETTVASDSSGGGTSSSSSDADGAGNDNSDASSEQQHVLGFELKDPYWNAAYLFDFLARVFGGGGTFFLWFSTCFVFSRGTWRWAGYEVLLAAVFQAGTFLWFRTNLCTYRGPPETSSDTFEDPFMDTSSTTNDNYGFGTGAEQDSNATTGAFGVGGLTIQENGLGSSLTSSSAAQQQPPPFEPTSCTLFWGSKLDLLSIVLWTLAALMIFCHYPVPQQQQQQNNHTHQNQQDEEDAGDGLWVVENDDNRNHKNQNVTLPSISIVEVVNTTTTTTMKEEEDSDLEAATTNDQTTGERLRETTTTTIPTTMEHNTIMMKDVEFT